MSSHMRRKGFFLLALAAFSLGAVDGAFSADVGRPYAPSLLPGPAPLVMDNMLRRPKCRRRMEFLWLHRRWSGRMQLASEFLVGVGRRG